MFVILTLILIVAAFNIISGLTILIKNKTKEIAILKTLGLSNNSIKKVFFLTGFTIGFFATITGVILGIARALGETMAIIMVMGNASAMPEGLLDSARTLTANIALEMSYASGVHASALYATGVILLVFIMVLNGALLYLNRERAR